MSADKRLTLTEYCQQFDLTVITRQRASAVPPIYRGKPKEEQILAGVANVEEVLLSNENTVFVCPDDEKVFETVNSALAHRGTAHTRKVLAEVEQTLDEISTKMEVQLEKVQKAAKKVAATAMEPTIDDLKRQLDQAKEELRQAGEYTARLGKDLDNADSQVKNLRTRLQESNKANEDLKADYKLLEKAHGNLQRGYDNLESGIVSDQLRARLRILFIDALGDFYNKVEKVVEHQAMRHGELGTILES